MNQESNEPGQLELDAFRFITGEMGVDEQTLFEDRLANEPGVADVLSQVLELDAAVLASFESPPVATPSVRVAASIEAHQPGSARSALPMVVALAACVLLAIVIAPNTGSTDSETVAANDNVSLPSESEEPVELVENWLEVADVGLFDPLLDDTEDNVIELAMLDPAEALDADSDVVPDWMFDAVQDENGLEDGIE